MAHTDDDYQTLKPTDDSDAAYQTLAPPRPPARPPAKRAEARPAQPAVAVPAEPPPASAEALSSPAERKERPKVRQADSPPNLPVKKAVPPDRRPAPLPPAPSPAAGPVPLAAQPAGPVCRLFALGDEARRLLDEKQTVLVNLYRLMKQQLHLDAVRLLAHALPKPEGIRWACHCARSQAGPNPSAPVAAALAAVEAWLTDPSERNRRASGLAAEPAGCGAAGSAALAVFLSGGSLAPPGLPFVTAGECLTARAVGNAVVLAALAGEPEGTSERYFQYLKEGIALATGRVGP